MLWNRPTQDWLAIETKQALAIESSRKTASMRWAAVTKILLMWWLTENMDIHGRYEITGVNLCLSRLPFVDMVLPWWAYVTVSQTVNSAVVSETHQRVDVRGAACPRRVPSLSAFHRGRCGWVTIPTHKNKRQDFWSLLSWNWKKFTAQAENGPGNTTSPITSCGSAVPVSAPPAKKRCKEVVSGWWFQSIPIILVNVD